MLSAPLEIVITLIAGTVLLLFLVFIVIVAVIRYQNRKRLYMIEVERIKNEGEQQMLKTRLEVQDKTLTNVSREIHDNIGQILSLVKMNLHGIKPSDLKMEEQLNRSVELMDRAIIDLRDISKLLSSDYIRRQSLSALLQREVDGVNKSLAFQSEFVCDGEEGNMEPEKKLVIFRIAQECIQNSIKHSRAKKIWVKLDFQHGQCALLISDDGVGFNMETVREGSGFTNLHARAIMINAKLDVQSGLGAGSKILLTTSIKP